MKLSATVITGGMEENRRRTVKNIINCMTSWGGIWTQLSELSCGYRTAMCCTVFLSVRLILQKSPLKNINAASTRILNEMSTSASNIIKPALTLSILFPTSIFTRSFLVQYVSSSLSQLSSLEKVSWWVTSYTAAKQKHMIRRARTHALYAQYN